MSKDFLVVNGSYTGDGDNYPQFLQTLITNFNSLVDKNTKLFTTDAKGLYDIFISNLPEEARQHYTCRSCSHFLNRFGNLVTISPDGDVTSVMFNEKGMPKIFVKPFKAMKQEVLRSRVTGVFLSKEVTLGTPVTGEWHHMTVVLPSELVYRSRLLTAAQGMAEKHQEYGMLISGLVEYPENVVDQALALINTETLYRSDKVLGVAQFLKDLHVRRGTAKNSRNKENIVWLAVATAPSGFCHVKSSMIGTLLDDIKSGLPADVVSRKFKEKMDPNQFMRAQVAPTQGNIDQAEKIIAKMGLENSLGRRYPSFEEIPDFIWKNSQSVKGSAPKSVGGVFGNITPKGKTVSTPTQMSLPTTVMTWDKFQRTVLPTAENLEVLVDNTDRLMALVTASDVTSENILQWDNPFSWYYHGGIDAEIKRRVEKAGGRYEDNEIRCSLIWEGYTDLDLHCVTPRGRHIYFGDKHDRNTGGYLDIDMNGGSHRDPMPVENIRWGDGAISGQYHFYVHNYSERGRGTTPFKVELEVNGRIYTYDGVIGGTGQQKTIFKFNYVKGQQPNIEASSSLSVASNSDAWGVSVNSFVKVNGITNSPNMWGKQPVSHSGHHIFFLLDGCKDSSEGKGRGFFTEMLKSELRGVRKTLDAYTANTPIEDVDRASACGVGYSKDREWNLTVKVTSGNSTRLIKIDRWD